MIKQGHTVQNYKSKSKGRLEMVQKWLRDVKLVLSKGLASFLLDFI